MGSVYIMSRRYHDAHDDAKEVSGGAWWDAT